MKKIILLCIIMLTFLGLGYGQVIKSQDPMKDSYIVVLKDNASIPISIKGKIKHIYKKSLRGFSVKLTEEEADLLSTDPNVKYVEEDTKLDIADFEANPPVGLDRIDQRNIPLDSIYNYQYTGAGVKVYIVDTGIYFEHNDFSGRAILGTDTVGDGQNGNDCNGHGTHVAGIAGGNSYGVAKGVTLVSMRIMDCQAQGSIANLLAAIDWIVAHKDSPSVINISLTFPGQSPSLETSMASAKAAGITLVAASGNNSNSDCYFNPGASPNVIGVAAMDSESDLLYNGSNLGSCIDILAPGMVILSAGIGNPDATAIKGGTSMASPHVAGVAALYLETHPTANEDTIKAVLQANATANVVIGDTKGTPNLLLYTGFDVVPSPTPTPTPTPFNPPNCSGTQYRGVINSGQNLVYPNVNGFTSNAGTITGSISWANGVDGTFVLQKKQGTGWAAANSPSNSTSSQVVKKGTYRWSVTGVSGSGEFALCTSYP